MKQLSRFANFMRDRGMMLANIFLIIAVVSRLLALFYIALITWIITLILLFKENKSITVRIFYCIFILSALFVIVMLMHANS